MRPGTYTRDEASAINSLMKSNQTPHQAAYQINLTSIKKLSERIPTQRKNFQVKPSIQDTVDFHDPLPLTVSDAFEIDLANVILPEACGGGNLKSKIRELCAQYSIEYNDSQLSGNCQAVIAAVAGQHNEDDEHLVKATTAQIAPVYALEKDDFYGKNVLAICYSVNGDTGLKIDDLKLEYNGRSLSCLGRENGQNSALAVIEIRDTTAAELNANRPEAFDKLVESGFVVVFVEYEKPQPNFDKMFYQPTVERSRYGVRSVGNSQRSAYTGMRSVGNSSASTYSVATDGDEVDDIAVPVPKVGPFELSKIQVYLLGALVVNTPQSLSRNETIALENTMQMRANELADAYFHFKKISYKNFSDELLKRLKNPNLKSHLDRFIAHALLLMGTETEIFQDAYISEHHDKPGYLKIVYTFSKSKIEDLKYKLHQIYSPTFCEYTPHDHYSQRDPEMYFSLVEMAENIDDFVTTINGILAEPRTQAALERFKKHTTFVDEFRQRFEDDAKKLDIPLDLSSILEIVFLRMFNYTAKSIYSSIKGGEDYIGRVLDVRFIISLENSDQYKLQGIVESFIVKFSAKPSQARLVNNSAIVIDGSLLLRADVIACFKEAFNHFVETSPREIEKMRLATGTQKKSSTECIKELLAVKATLANAPQAEGLLLAVNDFSDTVQSENSTLSQWKAGATQIRQQTSFFESTQDDVANAAFKKDEKKKIKAAMTEMHLRARKW